MNLPAIPLCTALLFTLSLGRADDAPPPSAPSLKSVVDALSDADLKQFLPLLKEHYAKAATLTDAEIARATVQGLIERLGPGATLRPAPTPGANEASIFKAEMLDAKIGYARIGSMLPANVTQLDAALQDFTSKHAAGVVLDLRATPGGSEFEQAAEVCKRFCPKGKVLFTVKRPSANQEHVLTSKEEPKFTGLLMVLVDSNSAGAAEVIAAVLRTHARAMIIGQKTRGEAVEFSDLPLPSGKLLRIAVAEVSLPNNTPVFPGGVTPDLLVDVSAETTDAVLKLELENGAGALVVDQERLKMNEAALVAGRNPDLDALQEAQARKGEKNKATLRDVALQRALDFATTISLFGKRPATVGQ